MCQFKLYQESKYMAINIGIYILDFDSGNEDFLYSIIKIIN